MQVRYSLLNFLYTGASKILDFVISLPFQQIHIDKLQSMLFLAKKQWIRWISILHWLLLVGFTCDDSQQGQLLKILAQVLWDPRNISTIKRRTRNNTVLLDYMLEYCSQQEFQWLSFYISSLCVQLPRCFCVTNHLDSMVIPYLEKNCYLLNLLLDNIK